MSILERMENKLDSLNHQKIAKYFLFLFLFGGVLVNLITENWGGAIVYSFLFVWVLTIAWEEVYTNRKREASDEG